MGEKRDKITNVLKYRINNTDLWIYSTSKDNSLYKYYMLFFNGNKPVISDIVNPIEILNNIKGIPVELSENSADYIQFLAVKNAAENDISSKLVRLK